MSCPAGRFRAGLWPSPAAELEQFLAAGADHSVIAANGVVEGVGRSSRPERIFSKCSKNFATRLNSSWAVAAISRAFSVCACCCQLTLTARSKAIREVGVASMICRCAAQTINSRSASSAALKSDSAGMNKTTLSRAWGYCAGIILPRQITDGFLQLRGVQGQRLGARVGVGRVDGVEKIEVGHFCVNNNHAVAGQTHDQIRFFVVHLVLFGEIAMGAHAGGFDDPAQGFLTPAPRA